MATTDIGPKNPAIKAGEATIDYVDARSGVKTGFKWFIFRNVPAETSWFQTLGFTAMALFGMQAVTGIILAMYYQPDPNSAYQSIDAITHDVTWGWLVRGMHKWGASAMIVVVFLHLGRVFFFGSYKYPRELTWVTGAILLIMTMFMGLTGYLLVWDQKAYWATVVAVNITASAPILGPYVADILRAGPEFGPDTLSRFYSIHMLVIPARHRHLHRVAPLPDHEARHRGAPVQPPPPGRGARGGRGAAARRSGSACRTAGVRSRQPVPADAREGRGALVNRGQQEYYKRDYAQAKAEGKPFFPYAVYKDLLIATLAIGIVIMLAIWHKVEVGEPVNPASTDFVPRPEWYFFFLFELLKIFKGQNALMPVIMATFIIPNILMALLILTPFIDRGPERRHPAPADRPVLRHRGDHLPGVHDQQGRQQRGGRRRRGPRS